MAFCAQCGAAITDGAAFCGSCGAAVGAGTPGVPVPAAPAAGTAMASNVAGCLAYILGFITGIIFLVIDPYKNDRFVRFHAFQSIFFNVAIIAFWIVWTIISVVLSVISLGVVGLLMTVLGLLIFLGIFVYWIFLMYKAYNNERYMIPVIGKYAAQQAG